MYLRNGVLHDLLVRHITLVAHQQLVHTFGSVAVDLLKPLLDIIERIHISHIVDNADAMCSAVVGGCDGSESLLTSGIPLARILMSANRTGRQLCIRSGVLRSFHRARSSGFSGRACQPTLFRNQRWVLQAPYEVDTNSRNVALSVCVVGKSQQQARLSHARVTNKEKLEKVIVSVRRPRLARLQ